MAFKIPKTPQRFSDTSIYEYDSDEDSINLENIDLDDTYSNSSVSSDEDSLATSGSDTGSTGSFMDIPEANYWISGDKKTKWYEKFDIDDFAIFQNFEPKIDADKCSGCKTPLDFFQLFFTGELCDTILQMTNSKLMEHLDRNGDKLKSHKYLDAFIPEELNALLGLLILTGVFHANKESIADLFSDDINKSKPIFKATMPRDRLKHMLKFLRFDDASTRDERKQSDRLAPIRDVFESLNRLFREYYTPGTWVTVDEHLARYRGKCSFKQYIPSKSDRYGIKIWVIADSKNYYPLILEIYIGKTNLSNKPEDIVLRLACVLNPGHIIVGDSYFTSLSLTNKLLKQHQIGYLGTIKKMRVEIPRSLHVTKTRELYSSIFLFTDKHILLSYIAKKNKNVFLLTNVHTSKALSEYKNKALIILDYNKSKSGVDKLDQLIKEYRSYRATARWPCVVFYDLIGFSTHAAWVLYCLKFPESKMVKTKNRKEFLYILGQQLVNPLIVIRKNSSKFKYYHSVIKTAITQVSSSIPTDRSISENFSEQSPDILDVSESESYVLGVETIAKANPSQGDIDIDTDTDSINSNEPISKLVTKGKRGRCNQCVRKNVDLKVTASCRICGLFVCSKHSKKYCVCSNCEDSII